MDYDAKQQLLRYVICTSRLPGGGEKNLDVACLRARLRPGFPCGTALVMVHTSMENIVTRQS